MLMLHKTCAKAATGTIGIRKIHPHVNHAVEETFAVDSEIDHMVDWSQLLTAFIHHVRHMPNPPQANPALEDFTTLRQDKAVLLNVPAVRKAHVKDASTLTMLPL